MIMKRTLLLLCVLILLTGCSAKREPANVVATTLPVYEFTTRLCHGTDLTVSLLVTENISCLHDYTLKVDQMQAIEGADLVMINGAGLEDFLDDALFSSANIIDSSAELTLMEGHHHDHNHGEGHTHAEDPHIWLSPVNAKKMAFNICESLIHHYPQYANTIQANLTTLLSDLDALQTYGEDQLSNLRCRELITFHDGFGYFAESFGLTILHAVEEESGSEASAAELIDIIREVKKHNIPAVFTEQNGSVSAANIISTETGVKIFALDMAMSGNSYFESMYHNINTVKEALQ